MSLLWRDRVLIGLGADGITGVRFARGFSSRVSSHKFVAFSANEADRPWSHAIASLPELLAGIGSNAADVTVILSNRYVRYTVMPWNDKINGAREGQAFARHCLANVYGSLAEQWELRLSAAGARAPRIASGIDRALLQSLRDAFAQSRLRLVSIQPYLMAAFNRWRQRLPRGDCMLLLPESRFYTCAVFAAQRWQSVRSGTVASSLSDELPAILDRERAWGMLNGHPPVFVANSTGANITLPAGQPWSLQPLSLPAAATFPKPAAPYLMALSAG